MKSKKYDHKKIENFWQKKWNQAGLFKTKISKSPKSYVLDMFPYPSGDGLHVGHPKGYIATDVYSRYKRMNGYNVLHPMGWDAFGLPAENYAIKMKIHPETAVKKNIKRFKEQLQKIGFNYDWDKEINTTDPNYYKWTQWIFLKLFEKGLAYESYEPINWCPSCQTGLANEDLDGDSCERCGTKVEKKPMRQWVLRITDYAEKMLKDLENLSWPESIKELQRNWIGKSEGTEINFLVSNSHFSIKVFTTRVDTIFGCTYVVLAPEHELLENNKIGAKNFDEVKKYIEKTKNKSEIERVAEKKEKTGIMLDGITATNPFTGETVPVFVADYVLGGYGTGAVMAVPAHDERDWMFAQKYQLSKKYVLGPKLTDEKNPPQKNKNYVKRRMVHSIVKRKDGKILCLNWNKFGWTTFVVGGIEEGENMIDAAKREVLEETGYKNLKLIKVSDCEIESQYFATHKNENRVATTKAIIFELIDEERQEIAEEEKEKHKIIWKEFSELRENDFTCVELPFWKDILADKEKPFTESGYVFNSGEYNGLSSKEAREKMSEWLENNNLGQRVIKYKIKDWVFSRQRYWGEPIPVIHCQKCGTVPVPEKELPVKLPKVKSYAPTGTGESPLSVIDKWVNTRCPKCKGSAKRETNTMPNWAGSCWYYLRYIDPKNKKHLVGKKEEKYFLPVDLYVGGAEHATRHLIYARFWHKFLYDIGVVSSKEPFNKLHSVGLILAEDGRKMSKRWGNVINPDDVVKTYGADTLRIYEMFMGPFSQSIAWKTENMIGGRRFLEKVWRLAEKLDNKILPDKELESLMNETVKKVSEDIENFNFNTAISAMMIFVNKIEKLEKIPQKIYKNFLIILSPFAPHITDEIWHNIGSKKFIYKEVWPKYDHNKIYKSELKLVLQVNGKLRDIVLIQPDLEESTAKDLAKNNENIKKHTEGKNIKKIIYIKDKLLNIVTD